MKPFVAFLEQWLPPRARVLEVGAGSGGLAGSLLARGHDVTPIDRDPPPGSPARAETIEEFRSAAVFDAVVAERSLHHVGDLDAALTAIGRALVDGGLMLVHEFCWDLLDEPTGRWLHRHMRRLGLGAAVNPEEFLGAWRDEHAGLATHDQLRSVLDRYFHQLHWGWVPYLADEYLQAEAAAKRSEATLLRRGDLRAVSFYYAGQRRVG